LITFRTVSDASNEIYSNSEVPGELLADNLDELSLNLAEISPDDISRVLKYTGYRMRTNVTDFVDYKIETNAADPDIVVIAIHGGKIEKGTTELAYALSSHNNFSYYSHLGIKSNDNLNLHVSSDEFAEPAALEMVSKSKTTLSIHGCAGSEEFTYIGGLDTELGNKIKESLTRHGFTALDAPRNLAGISPDNIVNKNASRSGVQIELSLGLREQFFIDNNKLENYIYAISEAFGNTQ
jgi:Phage-related replication protein